MDNSEKLYKRAVELMPGGVNSPVRAYRAVNTVPRFIKSANGSKIYDVDGREYIDYVCSWGPMILGHNHRYIREAVEGALDKGLSFGAPTELEVDMAQLFLKMVPGIEMVRMVNSGTEAVMSALRLARGVTGREKFIKFEGCYHGHSDPFLVKAGSSALAGGSPDSAGVPQAVTRDTLVAQFNDLGTVEELLSENQGEVAAIVVEPVAANMGVIPPKEGFLEGLRSLCDRHGALLIFDEVITGFRLAPGGAQEFFGVEADIVTFGKIIGGGLPVGAFCGKAEVMENIAPCGPVYQAGTLSGNPLAMTAGIAQLGYLSRHREVYDKINENAKRLADSLRREAKSANAQVQVNQIGSLISPFFTPHRVESLGSAKGSNLTEYAGYFRKMLDEGVYLAPAQFEAMFVSDAHSVEDFEKTVEAFSRVVTDNGNS